MKIKVFHSFTRKGGRIHIVKQATINKRAGLYFVSIMFEYMPQRKGKIENKVGIDRGAANFATISDGVIVENIKTTAKYTDKLAVQQRPAIQNTEM